MVLFYALLVISALYLITRWTDSKGWTSFRRASGRETISTATTAFDDLLFPSHKAAIEYRLKEVAEADDEGEKKDPTQARAHKDERGPEPEEP